MHYKKKAYPILEFDPSRRAVIEPDRKNSSVRIPERCVMSFFGDVISKFAALPESRVAGTSRSETGIANYYVLDHKKAPP